jgi:hypothetical protein
MAKLNDSYGGEPIGNDGLLRFIDDINIIRARGYNRRRFRPQKRADGVFWMQEYDEVMRPSRPDTPSPRYAR